MDDKGRGLIFQAKYDDEACIMDLLKNHDE